MITRGIRVLDPTTGALIRVCPGPYPAGGCPLAGPDGVVPCAGFLVTVDSTGNHHWPLRIPAGYRHCDVPWNERARDYLRTAETCRRRWDAGLSKEITRVRTLAAAHDPRYRRMSDHEMRATALWRWRLSAAGQALRRSEQKAQERADTYLTFLRSRHGDDVPVP
ncbi:hypothetical protein [Actinoplanes sp. NPDC023714]|uniref:hypothetical protein n=1 Tax=Actinoplanes sp. NPDC023714 TaxID=3154322 RepID=UPI0033C51CF7